jgi:hypothetical protein
VPSVTGSSSKTIRVPVHSSCSATYAIRASATSHSTRSGLDSTTASLDQWTPGTSKVNSSPAAAAEPSTNSPHHDRGSVTASYVASGVAQSTSAVR